MIYNAPRIEMPPTGGFVLRQANALLDLVLRAVLGTLLMSIGGLVIWLVALSGQMRPLGFFPGNLLAWLVVASLVVAMGILPFWLGFELAFVQQAIAFSPTHAIARQEILGRWPIWKRTIPVSDFDRVVVRPRIGGVFGKRSNFVVSCVGSCVRLDLAVFEDRDRAEALATNVRRRLGFASDVG
jgi:hypothetical protein